MSDIQTWKLVQSYEHKRVNVTNRIALVLIPITENILLNHLINS